MTAPSTDKDHYHDWTPARKANGALDYRMNRQMSNQPLINVRCECGARTWFTKSNWEGIATKDRGDR